MRPACRYSWTPWGHREGVHYLLGCCMVSTVLSFGCARTNQESLHREISTLAGETETVYFAEKQAMEFYANANREAVENWGAFYALLPVGILFNALEQIGLGDTLKGKVDHLLLGATNFQTATALGPVCFDGCYIITLSSPVDMQLERHSPIQQVRLTSGDRVFYW
jgi:hypothetical protein